MPKEMTELKPIYENVTEQQRLIASAIAHRGCCGTEHNPSMEQESNPMTSKSTELTGICVVINKFVVCPKCGHKEVSYGCHHSVCPTCYDKWIKDNVPTMVEERA
jgi:hypothetical protein